jgi:hypothetical protein
LCKKMKMCQQPINNNAFQLNFTKNGPLVTMGGTKLTNNNFNHINFSKNDEPVIMNSTKLSKSNSTNKTNELHLDTMLFNTSTHRQIQSFLELDFSNNNAFKLNLSKNGAPITMNGTKLPATRNSDTRHGDTQHGDTWFNNIYNIK